MTALHLPVAALGFALGSGLALALTRHSEGAMHHELASQQYNPGLRICSKGNDNQTKGLCFSNQKLTCIIFEPFKAGINRMKAIILI